MDLSSRLLQKEFAELVGVSESAVSAWVADGILVRGATGHEWLLSYCARLREQAAGRASAGPLDLAQERAALARAQRQGQELRNAVAQGEYAPIGLLADVLAAAAAGVVDRLDALPGQLRKACPDLPAEARETIARAVASARNEWVTSTSALVVRRLAELAEVAPEIPVGGADDEGAS